MKKKKVNCEASKKVEHRKRAVEQIKLLKYKKQSLLQQQQLKNLEILTKKSLSLNEC